ncbi:MAG: Lrp/AsnC family transcriptional regulator [Candidatus Heimdallarchaeaceae archaeon]
MKRISLNHEEYKMLLLLQNEPTLTYAEIARKFKVSAPTAKKKVEQLRERGIYRGKGIQYNQSSLGFTRYIFVSTVANIADLEILEKILDNHPYTIYRARFYGSTLGIFSMFDYPEKNNMLLKKFFVSLKAEKIVKDFTEFKSEGIGKSLSLDLNRINLSNLLWEVDWDKFSEELYNVKKAELPSRKESVLEQLRSLDFEILRLLTYNGDLTQRDIAAKLNVEPTAIWRRIKVLEEKVITGYRALINRRFFNLTSNKIIFMACKDEKKIVHCFNVFTSEKTRPPFRFSIDILRDHKDKKLLMLYASLPQYHEAQLIYTLSKTSKLVVHDIDTIGEHGMSYSFYDGNFDSNSKSWKIDEEYIVTKPIKQTLEEI